MKKLLLVMSAIALIGACTNSAPNNPNTGNGGNQTVDTAKAAALVEQKCSVCHSQNPSIGSSAPDGIAFDTEAQIKSHASQIIREVNTGKMPEAPVTITAEEKDMIIQWVSQL